MKLTSIAVATAVGTALALGSVVPAQAAGETVSINPLAPVTSSQTKTITVPVTVNVSPFAAGVDSAYLDVTVTDGTNTLYATAAGTSVIAGPNVFNVSVPYYASIGNYTVTATLDTNDFDVDPYKYTVATQASLTVKAHATFAKLTGRGKRGQTFHIKGKVDNKGELAGSKIKVFVQKKGHKKFKVADSAKIKANGKFRMDSKKIQIGDHVYFRVAGKGLIVTTKTPKVKIVKVF